MPCSPIAVVRHALLRTAHVWRATVAPRGVVLQVLMSRERDPLREEDIVAYTVNGAPRPEALARLGHEQKADLLMLRGLLADGLLWDCLAKRHSVEYGSPEGRSKRVAVPYLAADTPSPRRCVWLLPGARTRTAAMAKARGHFSFGGSLHAFVSRPAFPCDPPPPPPPPPPPLLRQRVRAARPHHPLDGVVVLPHGAE